MHNTRSYVYAQIMQVIYTISALACLGFYGSGRPFILFKTQLLSNGLVNMSLLARNKLENSDKATAT